MKREMAPLNVTHGLVLGLFLALPWLGRSEWLPWGAEALFLIGGFQLRLADRRWNARNGALDWISHIRMAPARLMPWGAMVIVAIIAHRPQDAQAIGLAAIVSELLLYPASVRLMRQTTRPVTAAFLLMLVGALGVIDTGDARLAFAFMAGIATGILWLRGPDGDIRMTVSAVISVAFAIGSTIAFPQILPFALPLIAVGATMALAHLSTLRRRPMPWQWDGAVSSRFRRAPRPLASPPS
ncbi:hypothetical protein [Sphingobium lactosutens]|nr:hypothetical protein [Sphingobium lactosutens]